ncbi:MAG: hypothetical protein WDM71_08625 [Ferruginibacter sp.]
MGINTIDDTIYQQNLFIRFAGVTENKKVQLGVKESDTIIDFVTLKAYIFPYINLVWLGLVLMAIGFVLSIVNRTNLSKKTSAVILIAVGCALFYMFLLAN